ncbi:hypothetical protein D9M71_436230 [compost metagenome]
MIFEFQLQQYVVVPAHQHQIGTAVDLLALVVTGQLLGAVVAAQYSRHQDLADAEGLHLAQVLFQGQAPEREFLFVHGAKRLLQSFDAVDHRLPTARSCAYGLEAQRSLSQQQPGGTNRILQAENAIASQQRIAGQAGEVIGPAQWKARIGGQRMGDGLGRHVRLADQAAKQVGVRRDTHCPVALGADQGFGGQVIEILLRRWWLGRRNHLGVEQLRQPLGELQVHAVFVLGCALTCVQQHHALLAVGRSEHGQILCVVQEAFLSASISSCLRIFEWPTMPLLRASLALLPCGMAFSPG